MLLSIGNYFTRKLIKVLSQMLLCILIVMISFLNLFFRATKRHSEEVSSKELTFSTSIKSLVLQTLKSVPRQHLKRQKLTQF